ncbi:unnamed protein product [Adineta ricciae]|uniref:Uncharacterized protein n=1 Tax=Adineta ricciae TaxID=249248 RepID=A0A816H0W0_ADIRI|nr:unnamed protein product [Adineta ricciae]
MLSVLERRCLSPEMNTAWTEFENAATYEYARKFVEKNYRPKTEDDKSKLDTQLDSMKSTVDSLKKQIEDLKENNETFQKETKAQTERMFSNIKWIMSAMDRVRMSNVPLADFERSTASEIPE